MNFFWFFSRSVGNNNVNNGNDNKSEDFVHIYCWEAAKFRKMAPRRTPEDSAYAYISRFPTTHRDPSAWDSTGSRAERPGAIATRCKITDCPINRHISGLRSEQFHARLSQHRGRDNDTAACTGRILRLSRSSSILASGRAWMKLASESSARASRPPPHGLRRSRLPLDRPRPRHPGCAPCHRCGAAGTALRQPSPGVKSVAGNGPPDRRRACSRASSACPEPE